MTIDASGRGAGAASLHGMRVAVLEARMGTELASLIERFGGVASSVPALREVEQDRGAEIGELLAWLGAGDRRLVVLQNGRAVDGLFSGAAALGREAELLAGLARADLLCRGPKPVAAIKRRGLQPTLRVEEPFTTSDVLHALRQVPLADRGVLLLHYGERNAAVADALVGAGARVRELSLYEWQLPEDLEPLRALIDAIIERRLGAVVFTSQIQARHLVEVAERAGRRPALVSALTTHTLVCAIGPTCADALRALGIPAHVTPTNPKMGPLVQSMAAFVSARRASGVT